MSDTVWLPSLVLFEEYCGNWNEYLEAVYGWFKKDFIDSKPIFRKRRLGLKRFPLSNGKEATFWHMISEGREEEERIPDLRRCERIRWPKPVIEYENESVIKVWYNKRGHEKRICLWAESENYLVILADRGNYILPWTAYPVERLHHQNKLRKEYEEYWRKRK